jgi:hypothetical protein
MAFFRNFLFRFQYPGGHVKPHEAAAMISEGIKFHPASFLIKVMVEGQDLQKSDGTFGVSPAEVTHLVFNNLSVTRFPGSTPSAIAQRILDNRKKRVAYDRRGDVVRYAKDILDYMFYADLVTYRPAVDRYSLNPLSIGVAVSLAESAEFFNGYDSLYGVHPTPAMVADRHGEWVSFASNVDGVPQLNGGIEEILAFQSDNSVGSMDAILVQGIAKALEGNANDIGRIGEAIAIVHEQNRLRELGRADLVARVVKIPERFGVGYDLNSFEGSLIENVDTPRHVEVKTTRSRSRNLFMSFKISFI